MVIGPGEITLLLRRARNPQDSEARQRLFLCVERELRHLATARSSRLPPSSALQTTELIDEAFMRLVDHPQGDWTDRGQFFRVANGVMRRILCDHVRGDLQRKRLLPLQPDDQDRLGDDRAESPEDQIQRQELFLALLDALGRLEEEDADAAAVFELRFFGGRGVLLGPRPGESDLPEPGADLLPFSEVAAVFGIPRATAFAQWSRAVEKLQAELKPFAPREDRP
jgi:RNA polymerase sigma factor (TIGR02999 family)